MYIMEVITQVFILVFIAFWKQSLHLFILIFQDDGLMVICDVCKKWQHAVCYQILQDSDAPERHVCHVCGNVSSQYTGFKSDVTVPNRGTCFS